MATKTKTKKKAGAKADAVKTPRTAGKSFKDVQIAFFTHGCDGVQALFEAGEVKRTTIRRAYRKLEESGNGPAALAAWIVENLGGLARGRSAPVSGDVRSYKAQGFKSRSPLKDKDGNHQTDKEGNKLYKLADNESVFMRLSLESLGIKKGEHVYVAYHDGLIAVTTTPPSDVDEEEIEEEDGEDGEDGEELSE